MQNYLLEPKGSDVLLPMMTFAGEHQREVGVTMVNWFLAAPFKFEDVVIRSPYTKTYFKKHLQAMAPNTQQFLLSKMQRSPYLFTRWLAAELVQ